MAQCPSCQQQVQIDSQFFGGLFTCPKCQSVYFIGFDGNPERNVVQDKPVEQPIFNPEPEQSFESNPDYSSMPSPVTGDYSQPMETYQQTSESPDFQLLGGDLYAQQTNLESQSNQAINPIQEIVNFGNSEVVDTAFSYKLLIRGLDITQNVDELRDILTDAKLGLNFNKLKAQIRNGELIIEKLDGAKAAIIAQRLRALPIEMIWEQKLYE